MQHFTTPSCTPAAILLVEDDAPLRQGLTELLSREGYTVMAAACAREAREKLDGSIRLIVLDITLPDGDGVALCRAWRGEGIATPILFLTAKDEEWDVVRGLDAGGNDYVTKPFRMMELLSRIRALLRTSYAGMQNTFSRGGIQVDKEHMQVRKDGVLLSLTLTEYRILLTLIQQQGIVSRGALLEALWDVDSRFIDDLSCKWRQRKRPFSVTYGTTAAAWPPRSCPASLSAFTGRRAGKARVRASAWPLCRRLSGGTTGASMPAIFPADCACT